jgi:hypothetical protein
MDKKKFKELADFSSAKRLNDQVKMVLIDLNWTKMSESQKNYLLKVSLRNRNKNIVEYILDKNYVPSEIRILSFFYIMTKMFKIKDNVWFRTENYDDSLDIIKLFIKKGVVVENKELRSAIVVDDLYLLSLLLDEFKNNTDIIFKYAIDFSMQNKKYEVIKLFIEKGIKIPEDSIGIILNNPARKEKNKFIKLFIDNGFVPSNIEDLITVAYSTYVDEEPDLDLEQVLKERFELLLRYGLYSLSDLKDLISDLEVDSGDDFTNTISLLKKHIKGKRIPNLRQQIKESYKRQEFDWQVICSKLNKEGKKELIEFAKELEISESLEKNTKKELCKIISDEMFDIVESCEDSNLLGDDLNKLPKWRIFKISGKCYDIIDLKKILISGETRNPFTREPLPIEEIKKRIASLEKMSLKGSIDDQDLFTLVRDTPIFSKKDFLNQQIVKLFGMFPYMLDTALILEATDSQIDSMIGELWNNSNEISNIEKLKGLEKKIAFMTLLLNIPNLDDKIMTLYFEFMRFGEIHNGEDVE